MDWSTREEVRLTQELVRIESSDPGTYEGAVADFVWNWLRRETSAQLFREPVLDGRDRKSVV